MDALREPQTNQSQTLNSITMVVDFDNNVQCSNRHYYSRSIRHEGSRAPQTGDGDTHLESGIVHVVLCLNPPLATAVHVSSPPPM